MSSVASNLKQRGFGSLHSFATENWNSVPDRLGVYVIFDDDELIYVGMAGRNGQGTLRKRLKDHASGQTVNMFIQYLLFDRILSCENLPRTPQQAKALCKAYIREKLRFRCVALKDKTAAFELETELKDELRPTLNGQTNLGAGQRRTVPPEGGI